MLNALVKNISHYADGVFVSRSTEYKILFSNRWLKKRDIVYISI